MTNKPDATLIALWRQQLEENIPPRPNRMEENPIHNIISFNGGADDEGMRLRLQTSDGQIIDVRMNPVVAHAIALTTVNSGTKAGWLEENGTVTGRHRPM